jgi:DNA-binding MarR family transcriptional regulator
LSSDLTDSSEPPVGPPLIGALLRMPLDVVRARMLAALHRAGFTDLVGAHLAVVRYPGPENLRPSELAAETGMTKQALNYLLGQLEQLGYLVREEHPDDARSKRIALTERGRAIIPVVRAAVREIEAEWERELGTARFAELRELLVELNASEVVREHRARQAR